MLLALWLVNSQSDFNFSNSKLSNHRQDTQFCSSSSTMKTIVAFAALLAVLTVQVSSLPFYPYGLLAGDTPLPMGCNPRAVLTTEPQYFFYGKGYNKLWLSNNGFVTFDFPFVSPIPSTFPAMTGEYHAQIAPMFAPYWSDTDTRCGGKIFYRITREAADLESILEDVRKSPDGASFHSPQEALIVTHIEVEFLNKTGCIPMEGNTFQYALVTDGAEMTFGVIRYHKLSWHSSDLRGPATAGVNAGDRIHGWNLRPLSEPREDIILLAQESNIDNGPPGFFVCRLDIHLPRPSKL